MTVLYAAPLGSPKFRAFTAAGAPLAGGKVQTYLAGTTTPVASYPTYGDAINGTNSNANPVILDANGEAVIFLQQLTTLYKIVLSDSTNVVQWTVDSVSPATGAAAQDEWITETNLITRISNTQFKVLAADVTQYYHAGRRVRLTTPKTYGTVTASSYATDTTVTVVMDAAGAVPGTLTGASYGLISYGSPFAPSYLDPRTALVVVKNGNQTNFTGGVKVTSWTVELDKLSEWSAANNRWVCSFPGVYDITAAVVASDTGANVALNLYIVKNDTLTGASHNSVNFTSPTATNQATFTANRALSLVAGDTIAVYVGAGVNTTVVADFATILKIMRQP